MEYWVDIFKGPWVCFSTYWSWEPHIRGCFV